jgi:hypothetical protein
VCVRVCVLYACASGVGAQTETASVYVRVWTRVRGELAIVVQT